MPTDIVAAGCSHAKRSQRHSFVATEPPAADSFAAVTDRFEFLVAGCLASADDAVEAESVEEAL